MALSEGYLSAIINRGEQSVVNAFIKTLRGHYDTFADSSLDRPLLTRRFTILPGLRLSVGSFW